MFSQAARACRAVRYVPTGWLVLSMALLALAACQPAGSAGGAGTGHVAPTVTVPLNYQGSLRITFTSSTSYDQAVAIAQGAGLQLVAGCTGIGPNPNPALPTRTPPDERANYAQTHTLTAGLQVTQAMADTLVASPQVISIALVRLPLCV